ncbi:hypothetical protein KR200_005353 [Drosophila serrata]|nr:hypothetical protein KR200_005353 [Drosophila serrata]
MATGMYVIFGQDYRPSVLVSLAAFYITMMCAFFGSSTMIMIAYCFAFILPLLCLHWHHFNQLIWPQRKQFKKQNFLQLNEEELDVQEEIPLKMEEIIPDKVENKETQHPEVSSI